MKKLILSGLLIMCMCGCRMEKKIVQNTAYIITLAEFEKMVNQDIAFVVVFTQSMCSSCKDFKHSLQTFNEGENEIIYEVILSDEVGSTEENLRLIEKYVPDFFVTPGIYYMKDGVCISQFRSVDYRTCINDFTEWLKQV